jgi:DNA-binding CsgD family transcriptional regulator
MAARLAFGAAQRRVHALVDAGLESVELRLAVLREIAGVIPIDGAFFPTSDPATLLHTSAVRIDIPDALASRFLDNELATPDVNKFRSLAAQRSAVATLDVATRGDRSISPRAREIMLPAGLGDELRVAFRTSAATWGFACLHRAIGGSFTDEEIHFMQAVAPHVGEALRRAVVAARAASDPSPDAPGVLTVADDLTLIAATAAGERWLDDLATAERPPSRPLPVAVMSIVRSLQYDARPTYTPSITVRAASGRWLVLHASHLGSADDGRVAVVIGPASRVELEPALAAGYGLTPREAQVMTHVLRGLASKTIANTMHITTNTANDHLKSIFTKTGASSRGQLMAVVFRDSHSLRSRD